MSDELKTIKFQLMLSPSEADAIDDWGFKNRIRTRAEAIRRLCFIGIMINEREQELRPVVEKLINDLAKAYPQEPERYRRLDTDGLQKFELEEIADILRSTSVAYTDLIEPLHELLAALEAVRTERNLKAAAEVVQRTLEAVRAKRDAEIQDRKDRDLFSNNPEIADRSLEKD